MQDFENQMGVNGLKVTLFRNSKAILTNSKQLTCLTVFLSAKQLTRQLMFNNDKNVL